MADAELPICTACGSQTDLISGSHPTNCKICDDPRQFVPAAGQSWTTLSAMRKAHKNIIKQDAQDPKLWSIRTEPKFGIGQRCFLIETEHGNVLWDMIALIDDETVDFIKSRGPLKAIAVSHPHYWTTHAHWAAAFPTTPLYLAADDKEWLTQQPSPSASNYVFVDGPRGSTTALVPGTTLIKAGGHFPGSFLLHSRNSLFLADTIVTVPAAYTPHPRPKGMNSFVFQWSIPNAIPLPPGEILGVWRSVKPFEFEATYGAFEGMDVRDQGIKGRLLESAKIQARGEGWEGVEGVEIFKETA